MGIKRFEYVFHIVRAVTSVVIRGTGLMVAASHSAIINLGLWGSDIVCAQYN